ncbi:conserved hypothetical protein (plasmid) [Borreliella garinii PBr]|uniref:Uncharacterized protein n=1 Tax=Borreliella garinii PBr TaxID=498743 RepID=B8F0X2_BORGR|nr:conserved hypothetical protein [Borreliella garinii PBr]
MFMFFLLIGTNNYIAKTIFANFFTKIFVKNGGLAKFST